jgi:hypothetical protein
MARSSDMDFDPAEQPSGCDNVDKLLNRFSRAFTVVSKGDAPTSNSGKAPSKALREISIAVTVGHDLNKEGSISWPNSGLSYTWKVMKPNFVRVAGKPPESCVPVISNALKLEQSPISGGSEPM